MSDIFMCLNSSGPSAHECYRFTAKADSSGWQAYGQFKHGHEKQCADYIPIKLEPKKKLKN